MGRDIDLTDGGVASFLEDVANGVAAATLVAPADLTGASGSYAMELLDALPGGPEFLRIDAAGKWTTNTGTAGSLDNAYDSGGPGAGRAITADAGSVDITVPLAAGNHGLTITQNDNFGVVSLIKSTSGIGNMLNLADAGAGISLNITKSTATGFFLNLGGLTSTLTVDANGALEQQVGGTVLPALFSKISAGIQAVVTVQSSGTGPAIHVDQTGPGTDAAIIRIEADTALDASIEFWENAVQRFELGYDDSAGGLVLGRLSFTNPAWFVEDGTGDFGVNELDPDAKFHVTSTAALASLVESSNATCRLGLRASGTTDENQVGVQAVGDNLELFAVGASRVIVSDKWSVDVAGNASFGVTSDAADHSVSIPSGTGQMSEIFMGVAGIGGTGLLTMRWTVDTDQLLFITGDSGQFSYREEGMVIGNPGGAFSGTNSLVFENGTAPTSTPTNSALLYSEDVAASAELKVRDEAGNITVLSPHSERHGHKLSEDSAWSFYSERDGKYIWVDMLRVVRVLERLSGEELAFMGEAA